MDYHSYKGSLLVVGISLLFFLGCFETRQVETPSSTASDWISPTDYQILLSNLSTAITQRNTQNYIRCFERDQLRFTPAAALLNANPSIWSNWSIEDEQTYINNLFANLTGVNGGLLTLTEVDLQDVSADSLRYVGNYIYQVRHADTTITNEFRGQLSYVIKRNEFNEWAIHRWEDIETVPDSSWSLLKLTYIQ
ncbi:MAG: hypothetical protein AAF824_19865 [Bacteroidota bacterium]